MAFERRRVECRAVARRHADEEDRHRGDLSPPEHLKTSAWAQNLSLPPAQAGGHPAQLGLGNGHQLHPHGAGLRLSLRCRPVLSRRLSITIESAFCIEAVEEAIAPYGKPDIFNTDQGSQFTSIDFTAAQKKAEIEISMDGKGAWRDNVFVERLWRSIKYEEV